jgi:phage shock protein A
MRRSTILVFMMICLPILAACREQAKAPETDIAAVRQAIIQKTERLYWIHLRLDSASKAITEAEEKARSADCADAEYLAAEAYRNVEKADEALLELGRELQELFDLDIESANRN